MSAMNKAVNVLGWLGVAAVVVAILLGGFPLFGVPPLLKPEWAKFSWYAAVTGLVAGLALTWWRRSSTP